MKYMEDHMAEHYEVILRSIGAFIMLLIGSRLLGKQTISQMRIFDFISAISIGAITGNLAFNLDIKIHHLLLAFFIFIFTAILTAVIAMKNRKLRKFLSGDPTVVIQNGKILEDNMKKMRYTLDYLNQQLREKDVFNIQEVLYALVETKGTLTVLKKPQYRNVTMQDMHLYIHSERKLPIELIMDGKVIEENLQQNNLSTQWLDDELKKRQLYITDVFYAVLLAQNNLYIDCYNDYISAPIDIE